ncbi:bifunctional [glutamine synthetase] adenylyltransferase/[glutamine synthetase]-adenylyl-L-tyrosine phosphorylase [Nocardioides zeae]|uniref:Bifunctional glutamine synthetase adenylyltransferase/adenylyl-removing enzyme n=1 Tax=Nocardioides imazamoxiresistens TaxID=3231893 RepID=A0ABU3Q090_9ACTN|nr:bifunctional [glutamine synthetase] adenylyltransferase/[glutamine synthetase]-adenylyl-L-tyrosine phosphorylase [Nocardioides zeae]MDT9594933.1 bifunctional [glutamine synthetase] adenylyltransferase/[glutamine synthetase]-adenylyl-L-tyrosine phosphorylase [Nocardioides zeae]
MSTGPGERAPSRAALLRVGFDDVDEARERLAELGPQAVELLAILGHAADPDTAVLQLLRVAEALDEQGPAGERAAFLDALVDDEGTAMRVLTVLGASTALGDHLIRHPEQWHELTDPSSGSTRPAAWAIREGLLLAVGADPTAAAPVADVATPEADRAAVDALRVEYRRWLLRLAARDLAHHLGVDDVAAELSDLAAGTLEAALAVARGRVGEQAAKVRLAVVALGKCGGHELNYVSDVDVVFVHEPVLDEAGEPQIGPDAALRVASRLCTQLISVCSDHTGEGTIWPVDANLRPEGRRGSLSRTLASHEGYYDRWASTWEFQALLKARPVAGDAELGRAYHEMAQGFVWRAAERDNFVPEVQAMRRRVLEHIPSRDAERQLKLGSGGLRDVEFAVQLLQLVHGRADERIRQPTTLSALAALRRGGYVGLEDGQALHDAYAFLRTLEHRMQLWQMRRIHVVPDDPEALQRLGRSMGHLRSSTEQLEKQWRHHRREVRRLHEKLFYRPLLAAVARISSEDARLSPEAAQNRLAALGYVDPAAALRHLEALTAGLSRTAAIQRTLLPVMLSWFADAPDPDAGLLGFRRISESLGATPWYLRLLRDEGEVARRLAHLLGTSRYATDLLQREPEGVRILGQDLAPLSSETLTAEMLAGVRRQDGLTAAVRTIRAIRRRELFRISAGELLEINDVDVVGAALSRLTDATLEATLTAVTAHVTRERNLVAPPTRMAIVAMGRYGGFELSYGSDADVMFVHDPVPDADPAKAASFAQAVVSELRRQLATAGTDPALEVDADLRPEGKQGPMVRTLEAYAAYYRRWSAVWEFQALLRADAVVGDEDVRRRFHELVDPLRFPAEGIGDDDVSEVRRIKARVDTERLPRGADPSTHLKLGRGGLADIEWTVQLLQMRYAGRVAALRTPRTVEALGAAAEADLVGVDDATTLVESWRLVSRVRNAVTLVRGKAGDQLPRDPRERAAVAAVMGYPVGQDALANDLLRAMRRARAVVDRVFWE